MNSAIFLVAEVELEGERLELCRLDVAALFSSFDEVSTPWVSRSSCMEFWLKSFCLSFR